MLEGCGGSAPPAASPSGVGSWRNRHGAGGFGVVADPVTAERAVCTSRFQNDLAACVTLFELSIGLAYLGQRIDLGDWDVEPAGGD